MEVKITNTFSDRVDRIIVNAKKLPFAMTREMAQVLRERIKQNIPINRDGSGRSAHSKHSTPTPLEKHLRSRGNRSGGSAEHTVGFKGDEISKGTLSAAVEYGTDEHPQEGNPHNRGWHPGAAPTNFFSDAVREFNANDFDKIVDKYREELFRR